MITPLRIFAGHLSDVNVSLRLCWDDDLRVLRPLLTSLCGHLPRLFGSIPTPTTLPLGQRTSPVDSGISRRENRCGSFRATLIV